MTKRRKKTDEKKLWKLKNFVSGLFYYAGMNKGIWFTLFKMQDAISWVYAESPIHSSGQEVYISSWSPYFINLTIFPQYKWHGVQSLSI